MLHELPMFGTVSRAPSIATRALPTPWMAKWRLPRAGGFEDWLHAEREQLALWLPVAIGAGMSAWALLPSAPGWIAFLFLMGALACIGIAAGTQTRIGRAMIIFALAAALGCALIWLRANQVAAPRLERPVVTSFTAVVEAVEPLPAQGDVRLLLKPGTDAKLPPRIRVNVPDPERKIALAPGTTIRLRARLMPPAPMSVPGGYDFARTAWFKGVGATGRAFEAPTIIARDPPSGFWATLGVWRARLTAHILARVEGGEGAVAASFVTGDRGALPEADAEAMRRSGLSHLLSISGLHVTAMVGAAMLLTLRLLALSPTLALRLPLVLIAAGVGATAGIGYTLLSGAEVPTVRSCIAAILVLGGLALGREAMTLRLVATGAIVVLLFWPESLAGPSFQLSFAAVTAIVALHEHPRLRALVAQRDESVVMRFARVVMTLFVTGVAVEIALAPIALFHFHQAGMLGALANIVAIPLTTFVVMPLEAVALLLDLAGLGSPAWWLAGQALGLLLWIAHTVAAAPGAVALMPSMPRGAFALMIVGGLWIALWRTRVRRLGILPFALGAAWALVTQPPDLIVTGDGRHLAIRRPDGSMAILRDRAGDYVRDMLSEVSGYDGTLTAIAELPEARCSRDLCAFDVVRDGRTWRVLATRTRYLVNWSEMIEACATADIVVADRRLPPGCTPRWLKIDRALLGRTGGVAISLGERPRVQTVSARVGDHPWREPPRLPGTAAASMRSRYIRGSLCGQQDRGDALPVSNDRPSRTHDDPPNPAPFSARLRQRWSSANAAACAARSEHSSGRGRQR